MGAIVGGILGGLALLAFIVVAILFNRRLKTRPVGAQYNGPMRQDIKIRKLVPKEALGETLDLAELPSGSGPAELSSGRHAETNELPNDTRRAYIIYV